ncbi:hypothetical protein MBLNU459_g8060t1 [Dothideomycetes sp. NU459]
MTLYDVLGTAHPQQIALSFASLFLFYHISTAIWSIYFSPLKHIPGPWYTPITRAFHIWHCFRGDVAPWLKELHDKYGDVVRFSPNEISFISGETAWQDIYGFRTGRSKETGTFLKDPGFYAPSGSMLVAGDGDHGRMRKVISHAFSDKALREQEGLVQGYVDLLVNRLKETIASGSNNSVNLTQWYDWTTFDIIADLFYGKPFGCLQELKAHRHVELILKNVKSVHIYYTMIYWPLLKSVLLYVYRNRFAGRAEFRAWCYEQGQQRINSETQRPDFISAILAHNDKREGGGLSDKDINENGVLFLTAGTETSATTVTAVTFQLLKHPECLETLKKEVRGRFKSNDEITLDAVGQLEYMLAVLNESQRVLAPVPAGFMRKVPTTGATVSGIYIPGNANASAAVTQYPTYRSERNFKDADSFIPERWLGDERFKDDNRAVFNPFSTGPRNCVGKNLAYAEMRLMLAKMVFNFDWELDARSFGWLQDLKAYTLWSKPPLHVKLTAVN